MKQKAARYAKDGVTPTTWEAEAVVKSLMFAEHADPGPDNEVIAFYAREMLALIDAARKEETDLA